jgi:hypothetical protein
MPAGRVTALRGIPALTVLAGLLLAACGLTSGGATGARAWRNGYDAGRAARAQHEFQPGAASYHVTAFCARAAFTDIQRMKNSVLQWTEGFERGCLRQ